MPEGYSTRWFGIAVMIAALMIAACGGKKSELPQRAGGTMTETSKSTTTVSTPQMPSPHAPLPSPTVQSGELAQNFTRENNITINPPASILRYFRLDSASLDLCQNACAADPRCVAYTYVKPGGYQAGDPPMCYLMSSLGPKVASSCCISGVKGNNVQ